MNFIYIHINIRLKIITKLIGKAKNDGRDYSFIFEEIFFIDKEMDMDRFTNGHFKRAVYRAVCAPIVATTKKKVLLTLEQRPSNFAN